MRNGSRTRRTVLAVGTFVLAAVAPAVAYEEPAYEQVSDCGEFEIRVYPAAVGAVTRAAGDFDAAGTQGFRSLAGYIFGGNRGDERIAMTAPVAQSRGGPDDDRWEVVFFMPAARTLDDLPSPESDDVAVQTLEPKRVAVLGFTGRWKEERFVERESALRSLLAERSLPADGPAVWARYDPPWTLWFLRRNEIWIELPPTSTRDGCGGSGIVGSGE